MSIKCSEVVNFKICLGYYRLSHLMFEEELKYIRNYKILLNDYFKKVLNLQVNLGSKLGLPPEEFSNTAWLNFSPILKITQHIPKTIQKQLENISTFMEELEKTLKNIDDYLKEKANMIKKYQQNYDDISNELIKKYIDVEKEKISYLNSIEKCEDIVIKYYYNKKKIENGIINKINENELKILNDKNKEYESQKKHSLNSSKKHELEYITIVNDTKKYEEKFINKINESINGVKSISCEISDKLKDIIVTFFTSIRESFKTPLNLIDSSLSFLKETDQKEIMNQTIKKSYNKESNLSYLTPERYNLKSLDLETEEEIIYKERSGSQGSKGGKNKNKNKDDNSINYKINGFVKFEDGFEEMTYFENDATLNIVKEMFNNFNLVNHNGIDIDIEEEKNRTKDYTCKIISNMSNNTNNIINNDISIEEKEKNNLMNLLSKHHNRIIFLHILNDYRSNGQFELKEKEYEILGELFFYIINISKKENDYHCIEMVIILSKTYYRLNNKNTKIYLQNLILDNKYFKAKEFWEELLIYSISKEVVRSNKSDKTVVKNENKIKSKNDNIIFSQILSLIDNMFDFGVDDNLIKEIIEPKIIFYNIDNNLRNTINDVIESKIKSKSNNNNEDEKKRER